MTEAQSTEAATAEPKQERERSTIEFPYGDLESALRVARGIHKVGGTSCQDEQLSAELDVSTSGGGYRVLLRTAKVFGLVRYSQGTVRLTTLGSRIVDSQQEAAAMAEAFLTVPLYKAIYGKFRGITLPPTTALESEMMSLGVAEKSVSKARQPFQRSAKTAGFCSHGADRLVLPSGVSLPGPSEPPAPPKPPPDPRGNGGGGRHDLIEGLIKTLPNEGSEWSVADRRRWLQLAEGIFDFVYTKPAGDVDRVGAVGVEDSAK